MFQARLCPYSDNWPASTTCCLAFCLKGLKNKTETAPCMASLEISSPAIENCLLFMISSDYLISVCVCVGSMVVFCFCFFVGRGFVSKTTQHLELFGHTSPNDWMPVFNSYESAFTSRFKRRSAKIIQKSHQLKTNRLFPKMNREF